VARPGRLVAGRSYHLANMPGAGRRARLLADWNVGLLFGRDTSELGQLGHPSTLAGLHEQSSGGTTEAAAPAPADGEGRPGASYTRGQ